jgi:hypothetical protein
MGELTGGKIFGSLVGGNGGNGEGLGGKFGV